MYKKLALLFLCIFNLNTGLKHHSSADPLTLGIIGTALGGTALGLGAYNTWQNWRMRRNMYPGAINYYGQGGGGCCTPVRQSCCTPGPSMYASGMGAYRQPMSYYAPMPASGMYTQQVQPRMMPMNYNIHYHTGYPTAPQMGGGSYYGQY